jgi:hypothetical protein
LRAGPSPAALRECEVGKAGTCALRLAVEHPLNVTLHRPLTLRFSFQGERRSGDTARPSRAGNAGMSLDGGEPNEPTCGEWPAVDRWVLVTVRLGPAAGRAFANATTDAGAPLGSCADPLKGTVVAALRFDAVDDGSGIGYRHDDVPLSRDAQ